MSSGTRRACSRRGPGPSGCSSSRRWTPDTRSCARCRGGASLSSRSRAGGGSTRILPSRVPRLDDGAMSRPTTRYVLKPDPHSSHSIILRWLGEGNGRRLLDVGAADALLSRKLTERGWRGTAVEADPALPLAGAQHRERMVVANLGRQIPLPDGAFHAVLYPAVPGA